MNWDDLKVVLAVHRAGSLTRAAQLLDIDQSTAARRLAAIERDLGAVLFSRSKQGLLPTDAGQVAIEQALEIEVRAARLADRVPGITGAPRGMVRISSNPWILAEIAKRGLGALRASFPEIEVVLMGDTKPRPISLGEIDLALWFEFDPGEGEFAVPLGDVTYAVYAPAGIDPGTLPWMTIWNVSQRIAPMRWIAKHVGVDVPMALRSNDPLAMIEAIAAGHGKALVPACMGARDPRLARVAGAPPDLVRRLQLHAHPDLVQSPRIQAAMTWLRQNFADLLGDPDRAVMAEG